MGIWKPTQNGSELYHYGVKGMKWKNRKGTTELQTNGGGGGGAIDPNAPVPGSFAAEEAQYAYDQGAFNRAYLKKKEESKPAWQKKWERSDAKKELKRIMLTARKKSGTDKKRPTSRKRNKSGEGAGVKLRNKVKSMLPKRKSHLSVQWDDGSTTKIR